jgi:GT2 family glycosyltransferase
VLTSIIIPVYNAQEYTENCLKSIAVHTQDYEVVLIDNGSNPPYCYEDIPLEVGDKAIIYRNKKNMGFPAAVNLGMKIAKGDYVCILNNDLVVTPGWLENLHYYIDHDLLDVVGPTTNQISGPQQVQAQYYSNGVELDMVASELFMEKFRQFSRLYRLVGYCMLMKKSTWQAVGDFDEVFTPGNYEDDDFCLRAIEKGFRIGYARDVYVHHFGSVTHGLLGINYNSLLAKNFKIFTSKWGEREGERIQALIAKNNG